MGSTFLKKHDLAFLPFLNPTKRDWSGVDVGISQPGGANTIDKTCFACLKNGFFFLDSILRPSEMVRVSVSRCLVATRRDKKRDDTYVFRLILYGEILLGHRVGVAVATSEPGQPHHETHAPMPNPFLTNHTSKRHLTPYGRVHDRILQTHTHLKVFLPRRETK